MKPLSLGSGTVLSSLSLLFLAFYLASINPDLYLWGDNAHYIAVANAIASGHGFRDIHFPDDPPFAYPIPMFPLLLAPFVLWFGYDLLPMKVFITLWAAFVPVLTYCFFRPYLNKVYILFLVVLVGVSPHIVSFSHQVMTEIPFAVLSLFSLYCMRRYAVSASWSSPLGLAAALAITSALLMRTIGLALLLAACVYLLINMRRFPDAFRKLSIIAGISATVWLSLNGTRLLEMPYIGEILDAYAAGSSTPLDLRELGERVLTNGRQYAIVVAETIWYGFYEHRNGMIGIALLFLPALGFLRSVGKDRGLSELYVLMYLSIMMIYVPSNYGNAQRYVVPLVPFILYYTICGVLAFHAFASGVVGYTVRRWRSDVPRDGRPEISSRARWGSYAFLALLAMSNFASAVQASVLRSKPEMFDYYRIDEFRDFEEMARWARQHIRPEDTVMTSSAHVFHFWSRTNVTWFPGGGPDTARGLTDEISRSRADYVALDSLDWGGSELLLPAIASRPDVFQLVYESGANRIYRVDRTVPAE